MDIARIEEQVAARTVQAEAKARRERLVEARRRRRQHGKLLAAAREVNVGTSEEGRWLALPADTDPYGTRVMGVLAAIWVVSVASMPLFVWWSLWSLMLWFVCTGAVTLWAGIRYGRERPVRLVVTPRGYWALLDGSTVRGSGRVEELRISLHGYRESSAAHGLRWVSVYGPDGKLCESEQLVPGSEGRIRAFAEAVGARLSVHR